MPPCMMAVVASRPRARPRSVRSVWSPPVPMRPATAIPPSGARRQGSPISRSTSRSAVPPCAPTCLSPTPSSPSGPPHSRKTAAPASPEPGRRPVETCSPPPPPPGQTPADPAGDCRPGGARATWPTARSRSQPIATRPRPPTTSSKRRHPAGDSTPPCVAPRFRASAGLSGSLVRTPDSMKVRPANASATWPGPSPATGSLAGRLLWSVPMPRDPRSWAHGW